MTAQPTEWIVREPWTTNPARQCLANFTIEDVLALPVRTSVSANNAAALSNASPRKSG